MRRRPPFALVLVALVAALAGAIALVSAGGGGGGGGQTVGPVPTSRPARACIATHARATAIAKQMLRAPVTASVPLSATGRAGKVAVTLSENVVQRAVGTRVIEVRRAVVVSDYACARGTSADAARSTALTRAYRRALTSARTKADAQATRALRVFAARQLPALVASAQRQVEAHAQAAAVVAKRALARRALARARARVP